MSWPDFGIGRRRDRGSATVLAAALAALVVAFSIGAAGSPGTPDRPRRQTRGPRFPGNRKNLLRETGSMRYS